MIQVFIRASIFLVFFLICLPQLKFPPLEDQILIHTGAGLWWKHGAHTYEMTHSPLYLESLSLWQKILGVTVFEAPVENVWVLRLFGVCVGMLTGLFFVLGLRWCYPKRKDRLSLADFPILALSLLMFNPYFLQSSLVLVYDSYLMLPLLLTVIFVQKWDQLDRPHWLWALWLGLVIAFSFMVKELTPLLFVVFLPIWSVMKGWRPRHLTQALVASALSVLLFVVFLNIWAEIRNFHWTDPLKLNLVKFMGRYGSVESTGVRPWQQMPLDRYLFLSYLPFLWLCFPALFALFVGVVRAEPLKKIRLGFSFFGKIPFGIYIVAMMYLVYGYTMQMMYYFPHYTIGAWPILVFSLAGHIDVAQDFNIKNLYQPRYALVWLVFAALGFCFYLDPLMVIEWRRELASWPIVFHALAILLPIFLIVVSIKTKPLGYLAALIGVALYLVSMDVRHAFSDHSNNYLFGEAGFQETVKEIQKLKQTIGSNTIIASPPRDIALALGPSQAQYIDLTDDAQKDQIFKSDILVSRTYGQYSVFFYPDLLEKINQTYACKDEVQTRGQRFVWWWKCPL